jgi:serine/threonine-protein kinase
MYTLLCGQPVHDADTINELLLAAMTRSPSPLRDVAQDVPIGVAAVVDKALAFDQEARWIDARTMQQAVRALLPESLAAPLDPAGKLPGIQPIVAPIVSDPPRVITEWMPRAGHLTTSRGVAGQPDDLVVPVKGWLSARTVAAAAVAFALGAGVILWMVLARAPVVSSGSLVQSAVGSTPSVSSQDGARVSIEPQDLEGPGASDSDAARTARSRPPASSPIAAHSHGRPDAAAPALPTPSVTVPPLVTTAALPPTQLPAPVPTSTGTGVDWDKRR